MEEGLQKITEVIQRMTETIQQPTGWEIAMAIAGIASAIIATVAIFMTRCSIKAQNKQSLFEKRLDNYILCKTFFELVDENIEFLDSKKMRNGWLDVYLELSWITSADYFERPNMVITDMTSDEFRYNFLQKLEDLKIIAEKSALLFCNHDGERLQKFVLAYRDTISSMYYYQLLVDRMQNDPMNKAIIESYGLDNIPKKQPKSRKKISQQYGEPKKREELLTNIDNLRNAFSDIKDNKVLEKIKKQLILKG